ncbi:MAG TPA: hypothetical protein H9717_12080 [Candidatus Eisenbergiella merdipullorum]|uniref:DUF8201 domain-containing protein n=1 Tax=Candidatus Eisenbergiella merdipullorum TaxID=2838553 RepID=A0A9D2I919_9FIRM|nr:hypothetical protein [Candidatus Eisenbergiella merdipullorum]
MLYVLLNWCFVLITAFITGFAFLAPFERLGWRCGRATGMLMAGLAALTVYAQVYSLFSGVGMGADLLLILFCLTAAVLLRKRLLEFWKRMKGQMDRKEVLILLFLFLFFAYGTSRGFMHVDTGLYHAQAIRWIEDYGVVCGLGNLHSRFAYNSSAFALCALFSMKWAFGEPMHAVQGFLAWIVAAQCASGLLMLGKRKRVRISDFLRLGEVYYLTVLFGEIVSPATDYFAMLLVFYVLTAWLDHLEEGEKNAVPYALLSLLLVFTVTVKLSAAVVLALALKPAVMLIRERRWKQIGLYVGLGIAVCLPWMIRGVLISGWLFYPFTFPDLFSVDWKMEKGYADSDAKEIQVFARALYDVNLYDTPFAGWVRNWFGKLRGMEKVWVAASAFCTAAGAASLIPAAAAVRKKKAEGQKKLEERVGIPAWDWILYAAVLILGYLFWQFSAPLVRYGYAYVIALPTGVVGYWFCFFFGKTESRQNGLRLFLICMCAFFLYKAADLGKAVRETAAQPYYIRQQGYGEYEAFTYEVDGVMIYVPADGGKIGYDKFPSSPRVQDIELRRWGDLSSGFRAAGTGNE